MVLTRPPTHFLLYRPPPLAALSLSLSLVVSLSPNHLSLIYLVILLHPLQPLQESSQPSPLALLAATCSKIGGQGGAEGTQQVVQQQQIPLQAIQLQGGQIVLDASGALLPQQLELVPAQFTGNGWQIITAAPAMAKENAAQPGAVTLATSLPCESSPSGRKVGDGPGANRFSFPFRFIFAQFFYLHVFEKKCKSIKSNLTSSSSCR